jgi:hypothetical protein
MFALSLIFCFLGILNGPTWWWAPVMGAGIFVLACLWHIYLAWWRDRYELFFPDTPDFDTTRYQLFMDRWAMRLAWRIGIRWERPGDEG